MADAVSGIHSLFNQAPPARVIVCLDCGLDFHHYGARGRLPKRCEPCTKTYRFPPTLPYQVSCKACGLQCQRKRRAAYCSKKCGRSQQVRTKASSGRSGFEDRNCKACLGGFSARKDNDRIFCSIVCRSAWRAITAPPPMYRVYRKRPATTQPPQRHCLDCSVVLDGKWVRRCSPCRDAADIIAKRNAKLTQRLTGKKAASRNARKLRQRGVTVEAVNPIVVLERDRWTCQLCGIRTPKKMRGTYNDNAPEVDHILPIAKGGEHSYRNTQCACRKCNITKSSKAQGQTRLFG